MVFLLFNEKDLKSPFNEYLQEPLTITLKQLEKIKKYLGLIKFPCNFKEGKCLGDKDCSWTGGCCISCTYNFGYLSHSVIPKNIEIYNKLWNEEKGFLTDQGCSLLYKLRSLYCLRFICSEVDKNFHNIFKELLSMNGIYEYDDFYLHWKTRDKNFYEEWVDLYNQIKLKHPEYFKEN